MTRKPDNIEETGVEESATACGVDVSKDEASIVQASVVQQPALQSQQQAVESSTTAEIITSEVVSLPTNKNMATKF